LGTAIGSAPEAQPGAAAAAAAAASEVAGRATEPVRASEARTAGPASSPATGSALAELRTGDRQVEALVEKIRRVLDRDIPVLILGETGTGKELLARAIHADSSRTRQPFVAVNCASIPETLIEAELFGYEDGAFTGARRKGAPGKILQANGGTLFLDEIGDMPLPLQAHLLRVLQERQVTPLGSSKSVAVDLNIICATHRNLRQMIERQAFREDLYYRLNGLAVRMPPLRERGDLQALVRRILDAESGPRRHQLAPEVQTLFQRYPWPGNVRQLFQVLRTACVMAGRDPVLTRDHLPDDFLEEADAAQAASERCGNAWAALPQAAPPGANPAGVAPAEPTAGTLKARADPPATGDGRLETGGLEPAAGAACLPGTTATAGAPVGGAAGAATAPAPSGRLEDIELDLMRRTLEEVRGNISEAAKRLGISRNTIYRKLRWNRAG